MRHLRSVILLALAVFAAQALAAPPLPNRPTGPNMPSIPGYQNQPAGRPAPAIKPQPGRDARKKANRPGKHQRPERQQRQAHPAKAGAAIPSLAPKSVVASEFKMNTDNLPFNLYRYEVAAAMQEDGTIISFWADSRNGNQSVFFQRFTAAGQPIGSAVAANVKNEYQAYPAVATGANGVIALAWSGYDYSIGRYFVFSRLFDASGNPLDSAIRVDDSDGTDHYQPSITATDSGFAVTWYDYRNSDADIYLQMLDTLGGLKGANVMVNGDISNSQYYPNAASTGQGFVLTWYDTRSGGDQIYARCYSANGDTLGAEFVVNDDNTYSRYEPKACGTDSGFAITLVPITATGQITKYVQRYDTTGAAVGANYQVTGGTVHAYSPTIAHRDGQTVVTWYDYRNGDGDVFAQWLKPNGDTLGGQVMLNDDTTSYDQHSSKAVAGDSGWAFIWLDARNSGMQLLYGQCYDTSLAAVGPNFYACDSVSGLQPQYDPSVAAGQGGNFLAVWYDYRFDNGSWNICDIFGRLYDHDGNALTPDFLMSDTFYNSSYRYSYEPKVTGLADGSYMVAWYDYRNDDNYDIIGQRVSAAGSLDGANYLISTGNPDYDDYNLCITATDSGFGVSWYGYNSSGYEDLYARLYLTNGDSIGSTLTINDYSDQYCEYPSLAANDSGLVVVWEDYRDDNYYMIYGQRVLWDGSLAGGNHLIGDSMGYDQYAPSIAGTNQGFLVSWYDDRNGNEAIFGQYLDAMGQKVDTNFLISTDSANYQYEPSVTVSPDGNRYAVFWYSESSISSAEWLTSQRYQNGLLQGVNEMVVDSTSWNWVYTWGAQSIAATEDRLFFTFYGQNGSTGSDVFGLVTDWYSVSVPPVVWVDSLPDDIDSAYGPYTVKTKITDDGSVDQAMFYYQVNGGTWDTLSLTAGLADSFSAVIPGQTLVLGDTVNISYYVWALDDTKNFISSPARSFKLTYPTGVAGKPGTDLPQAFALQPCYPNPSSGRVSFGYQLPKTTNVSLTVYNIAGQAVKRFDLGTKPAGRHTIDWNGNQAAAGVYFYRLQAGDFVSTKKLMIVK